MLLWRISRFKELDGVGGEHAPGRWHIRGRRIVYTAESAALALLEALVRADEQNRDELLPSYQLLQIEVPDVEAEVWSGPLPPTAESTAWGDEWLASRRTLLARVPASLAPHSCNLLINPGHEQMGKVRLLSAEQWTWDPRLLR